MNGCLNIFFKYILSLRKNNINNIVDKIMILQKINLAKVADNFFNNARGTLLIAMYMVYFNQFQREEIKSISVHKQNLIKEPSKKQLNS